MADEWEIAPFLCGGSTVRRQVEGDDEAIAALAARQHGVVARRQLLSLGIGPRSIEYRVAGGRLQRLFPGVYAVGHRAISDLGRALAAVLHVSPDAAASHLSAASIWGLARAPAGVVHVTSPGKRAPRPGLAVHRAVLPEAELTLVEGIPVTSVARTFLDLSGTMDRRRLRRLLKDAEFSGLVLMPEIEEILERYPRRRGRRNLRSSLPYLPIAA